MLALAFSDLIPNFLHQLARNMGIRLILDGFWMHGRETLEPAEVCHIECKDVRDAVNVHRCG